MSKSFIPASDAQKVIWLNNFALKLNTHALVLGVAVADLTSVTADAKMYEFSVSQADQFRRELQERTQFKNSLLNGDEVTLPPFPTVPVVVPPALVKGGILKRVSRLAQLIKKLPAYSDIIGKDLGIIGDYSDAGIDFTSMKPSVSGVALGNSVLLKWKKGSADGIRIEVKRSDASPWEFLALDTQPDYTDMHPMPSPGQSALWRYRSIYVKSDVEVGHWSDVLEVAVKGQL